MLIDNEKLASLSESLFLIEGIKSRVKTEGVLDLLIKKVEEQKNAAAGNIFVALITPYRKPKGGPSDMDVAKLRAKPVDPENPTAADDLAKRVAADKKLLGNNPNVSNAVNIRQFVQTLKRNGWLYKEIIGSWEGKLEPSYVVYGREKDDDFKKLSELAFEYNQDSFGYAGKENGYSYAFYDIGNKENTYTKGFAPGALVRDTKPQTDIMKQSRDPIKSQRLGFSTTARTPFSKHEPTSTQDVNKWHTSVQNPQNDSKKYTKRLINLRTKIKKKERGMDKEGPVDPTIKTVGVA